jgi:hypothetical protein
LDGKSPVNLIKHLTHTERLVIALVVVVATLLFVSYQTTIAAPLQARAIARAVPQFHCSDMVIEPSSRSWRGGDHYARSALLMPKECSDRLKAIIEADPRFKPTTCNIKDPCWIRPESPEAYTFDFSGAHVGFRYERHEYLVPRS